MARSTRTAPPVSIHPSAVSAGHDGMDRTVVCSAVRAAIDSITELWNAAGGGKTTHAGREAQRRTGGDADKWDHRVAVP